MSEMNLRRTAAKAMESYRMERTFGFVPELQHLSTLKTSDHIVDLIVCDEELDYDALNVFFRFGTFIGDDTPFKHVKHLRSSIAIARPVSLTRDQAMDAYIDLFRQAVARRADPDAIVTLSGGRDSRHILLELYKCGKPPKYALTIAENPEETHIAKILASRCGVPHVILGRKQPRASMEVYKNYETNFGSLQHAWMTVLALERDESPCWDGIAGDMLSQPRRLQEWNLSLFEQGRLDELTEKLVLKGPIPLFRDQALFPRHVALEKLRREIEMHKEAPNPVGSLHFWTRTRRNIAPCAFLLLRPSGQTVHAPYLDKDVWTLLAGLPARMLLDQRFHTDTIAKAYPEFASIPYPPKVEVRQPHTESLAQARDLATYIMRNRTDVLDTAAALARIAMVCVGLKPGSTLDWIRTYAVYGSELVRLSRNSEDRRAGRLVRN